MLKLGIIGLSEGNGHPYSWSAIFNGYNYEAMESCGYPIIPSYLKQQNWPECRIKNAQVTSIWTQDNDLSNKISEASFIKHIASKPEDMLGEVDALLLARDDAENHLKFAEPFLNAGLPIYIDKPIALSVESLNKLYSLQQYPGQIFTCSALRFSQELKLSSLDKECLGDIRQIIAFTPNSWKKYAVHIIEPVLNMLPVHDIIKDCSALNLTTQQESTVIVNWDSGIKTTFFATGNGFTPITIRVIGTKGIKDLVFKDSFPAFKKALETFINGVLRKTVESPRFFNETVVQIIEKGMA